MRELSGSALFGARFRENAARALLLPRARPGKRTPLWQQRLKAQSLLEVAKRYGQFPIVLETYRECLRDVFDLPGLEALLRGLHTRELSLVEVETRPRVAVRLLAAVRLRRHLHVRGRHAQRRAARGRAVARPRPAARAARPGGAARADRPRRARGGGGGPAAPQRAHAGGQRRRPARRAARRGRPDRRRGAGALPRGGLGAAHAGRPRARPAGDPHADRRRGALARRPRTPGSTATRSAPCRPAACPRRSWRRSTSRSCGWRAATRARTVRSPAAEVSERYGIDLGPVLRDLEAAGNLVRGELRPGGSEREWCDPEVLRRLRRASLATLRKEVEPAEQRALARFLPAWQGVDGAPPGGAGVDRLRELLVPLQGLALAPEVWERDVLPRRVGAYSPAWMDQLCASGELVWVGAGALGRRSGRVALYFREDARWLGPPPFKGERPEGRCHDAIRERLETGAAFWTDLLADLGEVEPVELQEALWDLAWAGEVTNDAFAPLRAPRLSLAKQAARRRPALRPPAPARRPAGAGALVAHRAAVRRRARPRAAHARAGRAAARALRDRHARDRAGRGDPRRLRGALRRAGQPGDARHGAPRLLRRGPRRRPVRAAGGDRAPARRCAPTSPPARSCSRPPTRPTRSGPRCPGRAASRTTRAAGRPACRAPTW